MQIARTDVSHATAPTGEPVLRVLFCGVGLTVDMASIEAGTDELARQTPRRARNGRPPDHPLSEFGRWRKRVRMCSLKKRPFAKAFWKAA